MNLTVMAQINIIYPDLKLAFQGKIILIYREKKRTSMIL